MNIFSALRYRFGEVEAQLRTARLELEAARALSKNQAEALVDVAETEKTAARNAQVKVKEVHFLFFLPGHVSNDW